MSDTRQKSREWVRPATQLESLELRGTPPVGIAWWWCVDEDWRVPPEGAGRCRFTVDRKGCGKPAIASLMRGGYHGKKSVPWDYCAEHLYGRLFEDGRILCLAARKTGEIEAAR